MPTFPRFEKAQNHKLEYIFARQCVYIESFYMLATPKLVELIG